MEEEVYEEKRFNFVVDFPPPPRLSVSVQEQSPFFSAHFPYSTTIFSSTLFTLWFCSPLHLFSSAARFVLARVGMESGK